MAIDIPEGKEKFAAQEMQKIHNQLSAKKMRAQDDLDRLTAGGYEFAGFRRQVRVCLYNELLGVVEYYMRRAGAEVIK